MSLLQLDLPSQIVYGKDNRKALKAKTTAYNFKYKVKLIFTFLIFEYIKNIFGIMENGLANK